MLNLIKKHRFSTIIATSYHISFTAHTFCHCRRPHHGSWHPHADLANYKSSPLRMIPLQQDEVEHPWSDLPPLPFRTQYHHHQFHQESHHSCTSSGRAHSARKYRLRKANRCAWLHPNGSIHATRLQLSHILLDFFLTRESSVFKSHIPILPCVTCQRLL